MPTILTPHGKPTCPNHGCPLVDFPFPMKEKGTATCPISGVQFEYEINLDEATLKETVDKDGNITKRPIWKLIGNDK